MHPRDVSLQDALTAVADPVRRTIVRELAGLPDWTTALNRLRHSEFDEIFPGLLDLVLAEHA
ncbi:hypothetical protein C1703_17585 [Streptomyces sp. Go-475]|nr:hypothetical protein C1703_17585 [Streptomyces sp. Go-475]